MLGDGEVVWCFVLDSNTDGRVLEKSKPSIINENPKAAFRLCKSSDFVLLTKQARTYRTGDFLIRYLDNRQGHARLGMAVSKKRVKHAVQRNRIKRIIRETFRRYCFRLPDRDYMISYRGPQKQNAPILHKNLLHFWKREVIYYSK